ncbi:MAG: hypothetical protein M1838_001766 [Thelocarpon superellum]|nr:MAG: hypothetical protein M1838_001766 [Thelocarpon superellum]
MLDAGGVGASDGVNMTVEEGFSLVSTEMTDKMADDKDDTIDEGTALVSGYECVSDAIFHKLLEDSIMETEPAREMELLTEDTGPTTLGLGKAATVDEAPLDDPTPAVVKAMVVDDGKAADVAEIDGDAELARVPADETNVGLDKVGTELMVLDADVVLIESGVDETAADVEKPIGSVVDDGLETDADTDDDADALELAAPVRLLTVIDELLVEDESEAEVDTEDAVEPAKVL